MIIIILFNARVGECFLERLMQPQYWADLLYYRSDPGQKFSSNLIRLHEFTRKVIRERRTELMNSNKTIRYRPTNNGFALLEQPENDRRKAFLDLLLDQHINSNGETMSEEDIREEVDTFMFEGHDTTAMALSWVLYLLGHHPEIQARAAAEVDSVFDEMADQLTTNNNKSNAMDSINSFDDSEDGVVLTLDKIKSLKYLECCVKEGLRLCPSVPFIGRRLHQDMILNDYTVPKGTIVFVYIYMLHRDPDIFPNPQRFDPDRFLQENLVGRHPFAFVPFSAGPRNCIGQRFAMSELKVVLAYLLRYFRFESLDQRDKISAMMEMVYRPKSPLRLRVYERRKAEIFETTSQPITMELFMLGKQEQLDRASLNSHIDLISEHNSLLDLGVGSSQTSGNRSDQSDNQSNKSMKMLENDAM